MLPAIPWFTDSSQSYASTEPLAAVIQIAAAAVESTLNQLSEPGAGAIPAVGPLATIGNDAEAALEAEASAAAAKCQKLPRYNGPKPRYVENPAHVPGPTLRPGKTPLPSDAESVFQKAVPNDPNNPRAWFGQNDNGQIYRYSVDNNGNAHFSGIAGVGSGTPNLTPYAIGRLNGQ